MSVPVSTAKVQYTLAATVQALPITFYFLDNAHVKAIRARAGVSDYVMVLGTDYTLLGAGDEAGGTLTTIATNMLVGDKITIRRDISITQLTNYVYNDKFPAEVHERALDKLTMITQQQSEEISRSIQLPETEPSTTNRLLPSQVLRASKMLGFDAVGDIEMVPKATDSAASAAASAATAAAAAASITRATLADVLNSLSVAFWGDSLTAGSGGTPFPDAFYTLTGYGIFNGGVGGETSTQIKTRLLADAARRPWLTVIWAGRNNYADPNTVKADIAAMVAALGHDRYLVLGVINGNYNPYEYSGGAGWTFITQLNTDLATIYGSHFVDIRALLVASYDPGTPQDVTDHANDIVPSTKRSDAIHLNTAGYLFVAQQVNARIADLQGSTSGLVPATKLMQAFQKPPVIGAVTPNLGIFSAIRAVLADISGNFRALGGSSFEAPLALQPMNIKTSPSASAGGLINLLNTAGTEKWRAGMRDMLSGAEGNDFIFGYNNAGARTNTMRILPDGGVQFLDGPAIRYGSGAPNGVVLGYVGAIYMDQNGGAGTTFYVKESGNNTNVGWVAK